MQNFMELDMKNCLDVKAVTFSVWGLKTSLGHRVSYSGGVWGYPHPPSNNFFSNPPPHPPPTPHIKTDVPHGVPPLKNEAPPSEKHPPH